MDEFRGLASVVEAWRDVRENEWMTIDEMDADTGFRHLVKVLNMADEYMTEVEQQQPINVASEVAHTDQDQADREAERGLPLPQRIPASVGESDPPVGLLVERQCNGAMNHHGHKWRDPHMNMETAWCNGITGVVYGHDQL